MMKRMTIRVLIAATLAGAVVTSALPNQAWAQDLADYDYENLSFRGVSFDVGYLYADNVAVLGPGEAPAH